jgi:quinolinate synthase
MNSSAAIKAFVGRHGGAVCTSSNARAVLEWALDRGDQVLFFPDQHLGRNTGFDMGFTAEQMLLWDPRREQGGLTDAEIRSAVLLLWRGWCSVHQRFTPEHVAAFRQQYPDGEGSTERILDWVEAAPAGSVFGIGTEIHMVQRLAAEHPDRTVVSLDPLVCPCSTMFRIDAPHLAWCLERLVAGEPVNEIHVDPDTSEWARIALQRMLDIT